MQNQARILFLTISSNGNELKAAKEMLSGDQACQRIIDSEQAGAMAVLHLRGVPLHAAQLIMTNGHAQRVLDPNVQAADGLASDVDIFGFRLNDGGSSAPAFKGNGNGSRPGNGQQTRKQSAEHTTASSETNGALMTEAQRRYLFRLLAEKKNLKGKEAEMHLKRTFGVPALGSIDKASASQYIDQLVRGANGHD